MSPLKSGPLGLRDFRLLAAGQFASTIGDYCYAVALPWLVLSGHGSPALLGTVLACYGIPRTVLIPVGGILADKVGHRTLMLIADTARCALVVVLTVIATRHSASLAALAPTAALIGAGEGLFLPASFSIMPSMLGPEQLATGNAISGAIVQAASMIGPAIGGALVATTRASTAAFAVDAASFGVSALALALVKTSEPEGAPTGEPASGPEGQGTVLQIFRQQRALRLLIPVMLVANLASGGVGEVALPTLAHQHYGPAGYGALLACLAAGSMIGTLAGAKVANLGRPAMAILLGDLVMAAAMGAVPYLGGEAGAAAMMLIFGVCNGIDNVVGITILQRAVPPALLGRLMGTVMLCSFGSFPLSVAVAGILIRHLGPTPFFPIAAATIAIPLLAALTQRDVRDFGARREASL